MTGFRARTAETLFPAAWGPGAAVSFSDRPEPVLRESPEPGALTSPLGVPLWGTPPALRERLGSAWPDKEGSCPQVNSVFPQLGLCQDQCQVDSQCPGRMKCCRNGCGKVSCVTPNF
ncbi:WAP four-disulfide core domain protein 2 isoform X2 [Cebus imitator]|uniref:WAP four-disulfide core domain protein 2 isoform X2 n=1 Tax=Cebus imitator TaxID=2715852 RepID=UPI000809A578|nr:WAP four-disulfide core domain protein 2 isoform X2 [Cebus imitator]